MLSLLCALSALPTADYHIICSLHIKIKIHSGCEMEDFVETHLCKLGAISDRAIHTLCHTCYMPVCLLFFVQIDLPAFGQAVVTGVVPFPSRFLISIFIAHRVQQSHCSSVFHRVLLSHALALSASQINSCTRKVVPGTRCLLKRTYVLKYNNHMIRVTQQLL